MGDDVKIFYDKLAHGKNEEVAIYSDQAVQKVNTNRITKIIDKFYQLLGIVRKNILGLIINKKKV